MERPGHNERKMSVLCQMTCFFKFSIIHLGTEKHYLHRSMYSTWSVLFSLKENIISFAPKYINM